MCPFWGTYRGGHPCGHWPSENTEAAVHVPFSMRFAAAALVLAATASGKRANVCFTAHKKTGLQCTEALADGPIAVYDDTESPQKARCAPVL